MSMRKMRFNSLEEYSAWINGSTTEAIEETPCVVDDGWRISLNMLTECRGWKTALKRFAETFAGDCEHLAEWVGKMRESAERGTFWQGGGKESPEYGYWEWGLEKVKDDRWYVFLHTMGAYWQGFAE